MVSVSRDKGTRHVGQRPSDPAADSHYHHALVGVTVDSERSCADLHLTGADNRRVARSIEIC